MIGNNIYEIRKKRGYTLSQLADRANVSKSYLSNIERNINQNPSIQIIEKLADVLGVELITLLKTEKSSTFDQLPKSDWLEFIDDLKHSGIEKEQILEYKTLIEFIKWKNNNTGVKK
ncbi:helix-turn-helix transcriptional regulator [Neobacillus sp. PS3-34]|uniref:helix-turn-helix domain-containing protein n=1 Tax=Neobacillus sp. PS3-34 TaxID=3070678 RepID=UPI0027E09AB5|nr:helix-turn-helix transcriptional regulator [Neobacillus sp. PS3-34]WML47806.1 helix-turn-helix transcriptional regulator [Neobacillus sp. PS3-34]